MCVIKVSFKTLLRVLLLVTGLFCVFNTKALNITVPVTSPQTVNNVNENITVTGNGSIIPDQNDPGVAVTLDANGTSLTVNAAANVIDVINGDFAAVQLTSSNSSITNRGTIRSNANLSTIYNSTPGADGVFLANSGNIRATIYPSAIDFQNVYNGTVTINQTGGEIRGAILLPYLAGSNSVVTLNGGRIIGAIYPNNGNNQLVAAGVARIYVTGSYSTDGAFGVYNAGNNNNILRGLTEIRVTNDINNANATTFTVKHPLYSNQLNLSANTITNFVTDAALTGSWRGFGNNPNQNPVLVNSGTLNLQGTNNQPAIIGNLNNNNGGNVVLSRTQNMIGSLRQFAGGTFTTNITNTATFGKLNLTAQANTATFDAGSTIVASVASNNSAINNGDTFNIVTTSGGAIVDNSTLQVQSNDPFVRFTKSIVNIQGGRALQLVASRYNYTAFLDSETTPALEGVSETLDTIRTQSLANKKPFSSILAGLDNEVMKNGKQSFRESEMQFLPDASGALKMISMWQAENMDFKVIDNRLDRLAYLQRSKDYIPVKGYVAGDSIRGQESSGPFFFGTMGQRKVPITQFPYNFNTGGVGVFTDHGITDCFYMGFTGSYGYTTVMYKNNTGSKTTISTTQGGIYGSYNQGWAFLDGNVSYGINYYQSKRVQPLISATSSASFRGNQASGRLRGGFAVPIRYVDVIPMGSIQYGQVHAAGYTENGGAALVVPSQAYTTAVWGLGLRLSLNNLDTDVKTEVHGMYYHDMKASQVSMTTRFVDGGPSFVTVGAPPKKNHYNAGASANVMIIPDMVLCLNYELLKQEGLKSSNFFLRLRWIH